MLSRECEQASFQAESEHTGAWAKLNPCCTHFSSRALGLWLPGTLLVFVIRQTWVHILTLPLLADHLG